LGARAPEGAQAIEWKLVTREPADTPEQILTIVDYYRCRWPIEEFNKALKTGCRVQARQLVDVAALLNVVALFVPIAWSILHLRTSPTPQSATRCRRTRSRTDSGAHGPPEHKKALPGRQPTNGS